MFLRSFPSQSNLGTLTSSRLWPHHSFTLQCILHLVGRRTVHAVVGCFLWMGVLISPTDGIGCGGLKAECLFSCPWLKKLSFPKLLFSSEVVPNQLLVNMELQRSFHCFQQSCPWKTIPALELIVGLADSIADVSLWCTEKCSAVLSSQPCFLHFPKYFHFLHFTSLHFLSLPSLP